MKFMMLVCNDPTADPYDPALDSIETWVADLDARGIRAHGDRLRPPSDARTVRVRGDRTHVTDGPFTELTESITGYDLLECDTLEEAVEVAAAHPMARFGAIEVRAIWPFEGE